MPRPSLLLFALLATFTIGSAPAEGAGATFDPEARIRALGLALPEAGKPVANYVNAVRVGNLVFLAGHGPCGPLTEKQKGKLGRDRTIEEGRAAARDTGLCLLASLKQEIGDLRKVKRIVKVLGMVNSTEEFTQQPQVINGFSDFMVEVFGERGKHARSAVGMQSLPVDLAVEIEMIVEVGD